MKGEYGFFFNGGLAFGVLKKGGFEEGRDYLCGTMPSSISKPVSDLNADGLIFWETNDPDLAAGQCILANTIMSKQLSTILSQINGSLPARTDMTVDGEGFQPCQRDAAANLAAALRRRRCPRRPPARMANGAQSPGATWLNPLPPPTWSQV